MLNNGRKEFLKKVVDVPAKSGLAATMFLFLISDGSGELTKWLLVVREETGVDGDEVLTLFNKFDDWLWREGVLRRLDRVGVALEREM